MAETIAVELPEDVLIEALKRLPKAKRDQILQRLEEESETPVRARPASEMLKWTGVISIGGDALLDAEKLYDD